MKQSIRALGWTINISMLVLFFFLATSIYSMVQLIAVHQGIRLGEVRGYITNNKLILNTTITINNTGYYSISDLNLTTILMDENGTLISKKSTTIGLVRNRATITKPHNLTIELSSLLSEMPNLLFQDTYFRMDTYLALKYAHALSFQILISNLTIPWGAPLYNFTIYEISQPYSNLTHYLIDVSIGFWNHASFGLEGSIRLEIYNDRDEYIGSGSESIIAPPESFFARSIQLVIENPAEYTGKGYVNIYFESPMVGVVEVGRINYG